MPIQLFLALLKQPTLIKSKIFWHSVKTISRPEKFTCIIYQKTTGTASQNHKTSSIKKTIKSLFFLATLLAFTSHAQLIGTQADFNRVNREIIAQGYKFIHHPFQNTIDIAHAFLNADESNESIPKHEVAEIYGSILACESESGNNDYSALPQLQPLLHDGESIEASLGVAESISLAKVLTFYSASSKPTPLITYTLTTKDELYVTLYPPGLQFNHPVEDEAKAIENVFKENPLVIFYHEEDEHFYLAIQKSLLNNKRRKTHQASYYSSSLPYSAKQSAGSIYLTMILVIFAYIAYNSYGY